MERNLPKQKDNERPQAERASRAPEIREKEKLLPGPHYGEN